jgi:Leucine-rich repeat (LRR) protein
MHPSKNLIIKSTFLILACLLAHGCNANPKSLMDEEYDKLRSEGEREAKSITNDLGCFACACEMLNIEGCVYVSFHNKKATDVVLERLGKFPRIGFLGLESTQITDAGLAYLKSLTHLQHLGLAHTQITDTGLEHLMGVTQLEILDLSDTQITDAGLENLKGLIKLRVLKLRKTNVTEKGVQTLKQELPNCSSIEWDPK